MKNQTTQMYNTPYLLKLSQEIEKIMETSDPVYTFIRFMLHMTITEDFMKSFKKE